MRSRDPQPKRLFAITFTGADENTDLTALSWMIAANPSVEIGLLYSATPEGRNRYPSTEWLEKAASVLHGRCAIHVCGKIARAQLREGVLKPIVMHAARVQVNGTVAPEELAALAARVPVVVTQHTESNASLASVAVKNHQLLVDGSGGRGIAPQHWVRPETPKLVGFAGGLGPSNIATEIHRIEDAACGPWWIDMESSLRNQDDWFDIERCRAVLATMREPALRQCVA